MILDKILVVGYLGTTLKLGRAVFHPPSRWVNGFYPSISRIWGEDHKCSGFHGHLQLWFVNQWPTGSSTLLPRPEACQNNEDSFCWAMVSVFEYFASRVCRRKAHYHPPKKPITAKHSQLTFGQASCWSTYTDAMDVTLSLLWSGSVGLARKGWGAMESILQIKIYHW